MAERDYEGTFTTFATVLPIGVVQEFAKERETLGPVSDGWSRNALEEAMVAATNAETTAAYIVGVTDDADFEALEDEVRVELRNVEREYPADISTSLGPAGRVGMLMWLLRFVGISGIIGWLGLPTPVMNLLRMAGESLGLEGIAGNLPWFGEPRVAVYWKTQLLGVMELSSWADFRSSMSRAVWAQMRVRMEG